MTKQVFVIFHRIVGVNSEWDKLPHFFSSKEKAEKWLGSMFHHRDDSDSDSEFHIQGYDMDPTSIEYY